MAGTESSTYEGFTAEERAAMKEHAQELKKAARRGSRADKVAEAARDVLAKIAEMREPDRIMAERAHAVIEANAPVLSPRLWYGMPAYALSPSSNASARSTWAEATGLPATTARAATIRSRASGRPASTAASARSATYQCSQTQQTHFHTRSGSGATRSSAASASPRWSRTMASKTAP
jgi:hypothetical protein